MKHASWQLQAFDIAGNTIGSIIKEADGPLTLHGTPDAFACCLPDIARLPAFFTDPDLLAAQLYEEYCRQYGLPASSPTTWAALLANKAYTKVADRWRAIATSLHRQTPNLN